MKGGKGGSPPKPVITELAEVTVGAKEVEEEAASTCAKVVDGLLVLDELPSVDLDDGSKRLIVTPFASVAGNGFTTGNTSFLSIADKVPDGPSIVLEGLAVIGWMVLDSVVLDWIGPPLSNIGGMITVKVLSAITVTGTGSGDCPSPAVRGGVTGRG